MLNKVNWLLTPVATDGKRSMMTTDSLKAYRKSKTEQSNLAEQIVHKIGRGIFQQSPLFVEEMMGHPLIYIYIYRLAIPFTR